MPHLLLCPDKFRGSLTAPEAAEAMAAGLRRALPRARLTLLPLSDGGEGFTQVLTQAHGGFFRKLPCRDPLGRPMEAEVGFSKNGKTAFVEMAAASGLALLAPTERNPLGTNTYGTGQLLRAAAEAGAETVLLGLGGSATTDGGTGLAAALGWQFHDKSGHAFVPTGGTLHHVAAIRPPEQPLRLCLTAATDVRNPLCGPTGAAAVFGPQKGASSEDIQALDAGLRHMSRGVSGGAALARRPGAGAAGGLGFGLLAFAGATLRPGPELVLEQTGFYEKLKTADYVLTGEGQLDGQTAGGKLIAGLCGAARRHQVPVLALCGMLAAPPQALARMGLTYAAAIGRGPASLPAALATAASDLEAAAFWLGKLLARKK